MKPSQPGSAQQTVTGKAYEYACLQAIVKLVGVKRKVYVVHNSSLVVASGAWASIDPSLQDTMNRSAIAGVEILIRLEPKILEDGNDELELQLQEDKRGQEGDVRDVIILRRSIKWEIGVSVKHNHSAIKHSRLSRTINFGQEWLGLSCSDEYFQSIEPVFRLLDSYKSSGKKWSEVSDKEGQIYIPILKAFMDELLRLDNESPGMVTTELLRYLLGRKDFYKIISNESERSTMLQSFNINGTLNTPSNTAQPSMRVKKLELPTRIYYLDYKEVRGESSRTTVQLVMDNNWAVTFRIHNASTFVETSLKFDIQLSGVPSSMFSNSVSW